MFAARELPGYSMDSLGAQNGLDNSPRYEHKLVMFHSVGTHLHILIRCQFAAA